MLGRLISLLLWSVIWFHSHSFLSNRKRRDLQTFQNTHTGSHSGESLNIEQHLSKRVNAMLKSSCTKNHSNLRKNIGEVLKKLLEKNENKTLKYDKFC